MTTSLAQTFKATRQAAVGLEFECISQLFSQKFGGLREGDYLLIRKSPNEHWRPARILAVDACGPLSNTSRYYGHLRVGILLRNGSVGTGRSLTISSDNSLANLTAIGWQVKVGVDQMKQIRNRENGD